MNIRELIEQLEEAATEHGDDTEVRLAMQPTWPFEYEIGRMEAIDLHSKDGDPDGEPMDNEATAPKLVVVYLSEGSQLGYLPGPATQALGWGR